MTKILKVVIVALVSAVLLTISSGCVVTTNTTQNNQASGVSETSGHALVQALVDEDANISSYRPLISVTWSNDTTAHEHFVRNDTSDIMTTDITYSAFPNVTAASAYFDTLRNQYLIKPESAPHEIDLKLVTGQAPTVYKALTTTDSNHYLTQEDTVVMQLSLQFQPTNQA